MSGPAVVWALLAGSAARRTQYRHRHRYSSCTRTVRRKLFLPCIPVPRGALSCPRFSVFLPSLLPLSEWAAQRNRGLFLLSRSSPRAASLLALAARLALSLSASHTLADKLPGLIATAPMGGSAGTELPLPPSMLAISTPMSIVYHFFAHVRGPPNRSPSCSPRTRTHTSAHTSAPSLSLPPSLDQACALAVLDAAVVTHDRQPRVQLRHLAASPSAHLDHLVDVCLSFHICRLRTP